MILLFILPILLIFLVLNVYYEESNRLILLITLTIWSTLIVSITEIVNSNAKINTATITLLWSIINILLLIVVVFYRDKINYIKSKCRLRIVEKRVIIFILFILFFTFITGIIYPPNNNDSFTYHLARVSHWIQNTSILPYSTHIERQNYQPPLAEYILLHILLLTESDLLTNTVQFGFLVGCIIGISYLAYQLKLGRTAQIVSMAIGVSIPMAILQASSTQNDIVLSFYLLSFICFLIQYYYTNKKEFIVLIGISLGLVWLTKGTGYIFSLPIFIGWAIGSIKRDIVKEKPISSALYSIISKSILICIIALLVNLPHYYYNYQTYHHLLVSPSEQGLYGNEIHTPLALLSNVLRNLALHAGFPGIHLLVQEGVTNFLALFGEDASDPRISFNYSRFDLPMLSNNEDNASNFIHTVLLILSSIYFIKNRRYTYFKKYRLLIMMLFIMFFLFSSYLKWQPWHSRLHMPIFFLAAPLIAVYLLSLSRKTILFKGLVISLVISAICFTFTNPTRPLVSIPPLTYAISPFFSSRLERYYTQNPTFQKQQEVILKALSKYQTTSSKVKIGLIIGNDDWDYMWYKRLCNKADLYHINVKTSSRKYENDKIPLDYIISSQTEKDTIHYQTYTYTCLIKPTEKLTLFRKSN